MRLQLQWQYIHCSVIQSRRRQRELVNLSLMDILHLQKEVGLSVWHQPRLVQCSEYPEVQI